MIKHFLLLIILFIASHVHASRPIVLISIDGFANEFIDKYQPPNIIDLAKSGVRAQAMLPVFPSKTFPNHLSIVTGVYPAKHGIIHNNFYNRELDAQYHVGAGKNNSQWLSAQPIWTIAEQQQVKTAIYFWPESEAKIGGILPSYFFPYDKQTPNKVIVDQMINWLLLPEATRPQLIAGYFSLVDSVGHRYGVDSDEIAQAVLTVDLLLGDFIEQLKNKVNFPVDIIVLSDHGMTALDNAKAINVESIVTEAENLVVVNGQTQLFIYANEVKVLNEVYTKLISLASDANETRYQVFKQNNYPSHWHFNTSSPAIPNLIVNALPPYSFLKKNGRVDAATHGYDAKGRADLNAMFIANGPSFNSNLTIDAFSNIHIFPLLAKLLDLSITQPIDGDNAVLQPILKECVNNC